MGKYKKVFLKLLPFLLVTGLCIFSLFPLFHPGFFTMHDDEQIARLYDLSQALHGGEFPPRISPNLGFGYGYPFFNFYPSFAYYVGELFVLFGFSLITSTKLMIATSFVLSAVFIYLFVKELFGKTAGVVSGVSYTYASYHAVDVYVRGAFAESFSFVFIPLLFYASYRLAVTLKYKYILIGALAVAGLVLSHNLVAFMSFPFIAIWLLYLLLISRQKRDFVLFSALLFLLGLGLSSYFWLPSYFERNNTLVNILTSELANYNLHFVCTYQLWDSMWGYGGSIPSCFDGISFEIGKLVLILSIASAALSILGIFFARRRKNGDMSQMLYILIFFFMLCLSIFLMVKFSRPIWDLIVPLWYVQFPWRFLLFASFFTSVLAGSIVFFIKNKRIQIGVAAGIIILLIAVNFSKFAPERFFNADDRDYTNFEKIRWETSSLAYEYVPKGVKTKKSDIGTTLVDINKNEISTRSAEIKSGEILFKEIVNKTYYKQFDVNVLTNGVLQINTYSFPGWKVFVNGKEVVYRDNNKLKLIQIDLSKGEYRVEARFVNTPIRTIGNSISGISIIVLIGCGIFITYRKRYGKT
ncbi:MAG TPA: hypothetical protein PKA38_02420 [Candidatus Levybacteria bacterium]|nr:hypothetical protein [Candidatus Levybacteria bacterium]